MPARAVCTILLLMAGAACGGGADVQGGRPIGLRKAKRQEPKEERFSGQVSPLPKPTPASANAATFKSRCTIDADCALVFTGDVRSCASVEAINRHEVDRFAKWRADGAAMGDVEPAPCHPEAADFEPRCQRGFCTALPPRDLSCADTIMGEDLSLSLQNVTRPDPAYPRLAACAPLPIDPSVGVEAVALFKPSAEGRYRIFLSGEGLERWLYVRTPDCQGIDVICLHCKEDSAWCHTDETFGPDDHAILVVRNCERCRLEARAWRSAQTPPRPPDP
jgi:hypothetical protein